MQSDFPSYFSPSRLRVFVAVHFRPLKLSKNEAKQFQ